MTVLIRVQNAVAIYNISHSYLPNKDVYVSAVLINTGFTV